MLLVLTHEHYRPGCDSFAGEGADAVLRRNLPLGDEAYGRILTGPEGD